MYIDSHCHLDFDVFDSDRNELMKRCLDSEIVGFLVPATTRDSWLKLTRLANGYKEWRTAYGLHPYFLKEALLSDIELLGDQCDSHCAVAVGEIGLDCWPGAVDLDVQLMFFTRQLSVAKVLGLPVILHARKSYDLVLKCLREIGFNHGGIVHAFNGSIEQAKRFIDLGFVLGIGGTITYSRAQKAHRVLKMLDSTSFVFETDSPDMPLYGLQGEINTPLSIPIIVQNASKIRDEDIKQLTEFAHHNLLRALPKW